MTKKYGGVTVEPVDVKNPDHVKQRLAFIAYAIKSGQKPEKFQKELDKLLGTEMEERDLEAEERWEKSRKVVSDE